MLNEQDVLEMFQETGAILEGHFLLSSGLHSSNYLQCALVLQFPEYAERLGRALTERLRSIETEVDFIIGPALGGIVIAYETARAFGQTANRKIKALFAEREEGKLTLRRGFQISPGEKGMVVEDVITTGGSTKETVEAVQTRGGVVTAVGTIINRGEGVLDLSVPLVSLLNLKIENYPAADCPLCRKEIPFTKPGSRSQSKPNAS